MEMVIGGFNSAARKLKIYHIGFEASSLYVCEVVSNSEKSSILRSKVLSDLLRPVPWNGPFGYAKDTRNSMLDTLSGNLASGLR